MTHSKDLTHRCPGWIKGVQVQIVSEGQDSLPITPPILRKLKQTDSMGRLKFLHAGELTVSDEGYDPSVHLNSDLAIDDPRRQSFLQVTIKQSKTDPFRGGCACVDSRAVAIY